ncbi:MAG: nuclear transport factor 2 family protein, partial [Thermoplasmata archaeon]|nr:nuclear transport factor 2 family protein [Thermoplasmata archaeon]
MSAVAPEQVGLMQTSREWAKALGSRDVEKIVSYWAEDAIVMPPDKPALVGRSAIREYVTQSLAIPGFSVDWEPELAFISEQGDLGYLVERSRFTLPDATGAQVTQHG